MLAKWWKKIALAICIVAVLFNVTNKLVHRTNIKEELTSVLGTDAIKFSVEEEEVQDTEQTNTEETNN